MNRRKIASVALTGSFLMTASAHAQPDKVVYELQERCGKRAAEVFDKEWNGQHLIKEKDGVTTADYENHYSPQLNKCFYLQKSSNFSKSEKFENLELYDLNDNKQVGRFTKMSAGVVECEVQGKTCQSLQEWRELTKRFLED